MRDTLQFHCQHDNVAFVIRPVLLNQLRLQPIDRAKVKVLGCWEEQEELVRRWVAVTRPIHYQYAV